MFGIKLNEMCFELNVGDASKFIQLPEFWLLWTHAILFR